jgi:hypothetical protein
MESVVGEVVPYPVSTLMGRPKPSIVVLLQRVVLVVPVTTVVAVVLVGGEVV